MAAIPSGTPIPAPIAVGKVVDCACICADAEISADVGSVVVFKFGPADRVLVAGLLGLMVGADEEDVIGGYPRI